MPEKFKLSINKPCSEEWENFDPRGENRGFCGSCQKEVIDFTQMSDGEIRTYFKNSPQNVCGQFQNHQLRVYSNPIPSRGLSRWLIWPIAASATLFVSFTIQAQELDRIEQSDQKRHYRKRIELQYLRTISGTISDDTGEGLPGVNVVIKGTTTGVTSDLDGNYQISVKNDFTVLVFSAIGMSTQEITVGARSIIDPTMADNPEDLKEVVVGGVADDFILLGSGLHLV